MQLAGHVRWRRPKVFGMLCWRNDGSLLSWVCVQARVPLVIKTLPYSVGFSLDTYKIIRILLPLAGASLLHASRATLWGCHLPRRRARSSLSRHWSHTRHFEQAQPSSILSCWSESTLKWPYTHWVSAVSLHFVTLPEVFCAKLWQSLLFSLPVNPKYLRHK